MPQPVASAPTPQPVAAEELLRCVPLSAKSRFVLASLGIGLVGAGIYDVTKPGVSWLFTALTALIKQLPGQWSDSIYASAANEPTVRILGYISLIVALVPLVQSTIEVGRRKREARKIDSNIEIIRRHLESIIALQEHPSHSNQPPINAKERLQDLLTAKNKDMAFSWLTRAVSTITIIASLSLATQGVGFTLALSVLRCCNAATTLLEPELEPVQFKRLRADYTRIKSRADFEAWRRRVVDAAREHAVELPKEFLDL